MLTCPNSRWMHMRPISSSESWNMGRWKTGDSSTAFMGLTGLFVNVSSCGHSILCVSLFFAPYHTLNQSNTDAITSDSLPRHPGTLENAHAVTRIECNETSGWNITRSTVWSQKVCWLGYPDGSEYRALLSMTYFADADPQPMPYMFEKVGWEKMKRRICMEVEKYNQQHG